MGVVPGEAQQRIAAILTLLLDKRVVMVLPHQSRFDGPLWPTEPTLAMVTKIRSQDLLVEVKILPTDKKAYVVDPKFVVPVLR
jgi:hypothetical protein